MLKWTIFGLGARRLSFQIGFINDAPGPPQHGVTCDLGIEYQFFCYPKPPVLDKSTAIATFLVLHTIRLCLTDALHTR